MKVERQLGGEEERGEEGGGGRRRREGRRGEGRPETTECIKTIYTTTLLVTCVSEGWM